MYIYHADLEYDIEGDCHVVTFPDIPEVLTQGRTKDEALEQAADALGVMCTSFYNDGDPIPKPSYAQGHPVAVPINVILKMCIRDGMRDNSLTNVALAKSTGLNEAEVRRITNFNHSTSIKRLERVLRLLGRTASVNVA